MSRGERVELRVQRDGEHLEEVVAYLDVDNRDQLQQHLLAAIGRAGDQPRDVTRYAMEVYRPGGSDPLFTFVSIDEDND